MSFAGADAAAGDRADDFGTVLRTERQRRGVSLRELARLVHYSHGYLSKVERGVMPPTEGLAQQCDAVLGLDGTLVQAVKASVPANPVVSPAIRPAQLPAGPMSFVGRSSELDRLHSLVDQGRRPGPVILMIDGAPGIGKTALAIRWAQQVEHDFDGVLFADLHGFGPVGSPADPGNVLEGFLRGFGVPPDRIPEELEHRAAMFRSVVHRQRVLVVLDNALDSRQILPLLPGSSDSVVLVTTRRRLAGLAVATGVLPLTLQPLQAADAIELITSALIDRDGDADAIARLAQRCGYLPLALRVAAERTAAQPDSSIADLADQLATGPDLLGALEVDDDEHQAVRAVFSWSYRKLSKPAARLFRLLGLRTGPAISTPASAALAGVTPATAGQLLVELNRAHLIERTNGETHEMHDLLRAYAAELSTTDKAEVEPAARRLVEWHLRTIDSACVALAPQRYRAPLPPPVVETTPLEFGDRSLAARWCAANMTNLVDVCHLAVAQGFHDEAWRIPVALWDVLALLKPWGVWSETHRIGLDAARTAGNRFGEACVLNNLGDLHRRRGDLRYAEEHCYRPALKIREDIGDRRGWAWTMGGLGFVAMGRRQYEQAEQYFTAMLTAFRELDDGYGTAVGLSCLGDARRALGDHEEATRQMGLALDLAREMDDHHCQALTLLRLGAVSRECGVLDQALGYFDEAIDLFETIGDRWSLAGGLNDRAVILAEMGEPALATAAWTAALTIFEDFDEESAQEIRRHLSTG